MNYYDYLGVSIESDVETISIAYKKMAASLHPDKHPNDLEGATKRFQTLNEIYSILSDPFKRQQYDESLNEDHFSETDLQAMMQEALRREAERQQYEYAEQQRLQSQYDAMQEERARLQQLQVIFHEAARVLKVDLPNPFNPFAPPLAHCNKSLRFHGRTYTFLSFTIICLYIILVWIGVIPSL